MLWLTAFEASQESKFLDLAIHSAKDTFLNQDPTLNICCGRSGRALALLSLYQMTEEKEWHNNATALLNKTPVQIEGAQNHKYSLFKGQFGVALAHYESLYPAQARFPLFI